MGGSSPPFMYGAPTSHAFHGPTDQPFNPKAVTESSWARPASKPKQKGPYVKFNRHPDSYANIPNGVTRWTPMSPSTKGKVFYGRGIQLGLRVLALLGALGALFCAIVIKNVAVTVIWIIRVGPIVAVLHTLYGIYHLCRSPVRRPAGSQASYMAFAASLDLGLIPFYVFSAYIAYKQITNNAYHWGTLLSADTEITEKIARATFLLSIINGSIHLISLGICVFLAIIFRQISQLPPDLNPLEDNLTSRSHKRNKSELTEKQKHLSNSTIASELSSVEDPLINSPRTIPFMHTRNRSSEDTSSRRSGLNEKRQSQSSMYHGGEVPPVPPLPKHNFFAEHNRQEELPSIKPPSVHVQEIAHDVPDKARCVSPESGNWIVYPSRSPSPAEAALNENSVRRDQSSAYSQVESLVSRGSSFKDWLTSAQRYERVTGETISEETRGEYESLALHQYYGNDDLYEHPRQAGTYDKAEQDIGDHNINVFLDHDRRERVVSASLQVNPLALNPPTPQPSHDETDDQTNGAPYESQRIALADIPNLAPNAPGSLPSPDSPEKKGRFYGELDTTPWLGITRDLSGQNKPNSPNVGRKKSKLIKRSSQKLNSYGPLKQKDGDDLDGEAQRPPVPLHPAMAEGDRKGRVVSNSGADVGNHDFSAGSSLVYGNYIANLGVGRRRDVSGKIAEEGRGGVVEVENPSPKPVRAAGWARFAGL